MDQFKTPGKVVLERVVAQTHNIIRIALERYNPSVLAHESGRC